jgi:hypothetical protein
MTLRGLVPLALAATSLAATAPDGDGFLPEESRLVSLASLPAVPPGADAGGVVRLAPAGRAMTLYRGRLVALAERLEAPLADWTPPVAAEPIRDFCWLDDGTLVVLRETGLEFFRAGKLVRGVTLPGRGMGLARADAGHCYVFGGGESNRNRDILLLGVDGSVRNLFRAPGRVTAVTGNGNRTFAAVGPVVYFLAPGEEPRAVFQERTVITEMAYAPPAGVFYRTADGVGCMDGPASGLVFLRRPVVSLDGRGDRLLLLTPEREVLLITPVSEFPRVIRDVRTFSAGGSR